MRIFERVRTQATERRRLNKGGRVPSKSYDGLAEKRCRDKTNGARQRDSSQNLLLPRVYAYKHRACQQTSCGMGQRVV